VNAMPSLLVPPPLGGPWLPQFACPECQIEIWSSPAGCGCSCCGRTYDLREGVWRFLTQDRANAHVPFINQYRKVRERDGHRRQSPDFYLSLPYVADSDPHLIEWRIRAETYRHLNNKVLAAAPHAQRVLDLGAGSGWLSNRLAELRHRTVAVDILDDDADGLRATGLRAARFVRVQADFDRLPFAPRQFDLVIFNASLHYANNPAVTLARVHQMLASGGALVVMDSPMFRRDRDGLAMTARMTRRLESEHGLSNTLSPGPGYLTFDSLDAAAARLGLRSKFAPSLGSWRWRLARHVATLSLGRAPASFGLWVAR
jgi:SAM-dependent methyltransferase